MSEALSHPSAPSGGPIPDDYPRFAQQIPTSPIEQGHYVARFATTPADLAQVAALRYEVFNLELGEGLEENSGTGLDLDRFDPGFHHLMVFDRSAGTTLVGTYRLQTSDMAAVNGYYSDGEFDLGTLPAVVLGDSVELGRACVARSHRNRMVLFLLWKGLAQYLAWNRKRFMFGCSSLSTTDSLIAAAMHDHLATQGHMHPDLEVPPRPGFAAEQPDPDADLDTATVDIPSLFKSYLRYGAKVCGWPAIDRDFKTVDFFMLFDLGTLDERRYRIFFGN